MKKFKVLSLFDGISCGKQAFYNSVFDTEEYHSFEINDRAKLCSKDNWKDIIYKNDVCDCSGYDYKDFDFLIGGSPCQDLSQAMKNRKGLEGIKSKLFFEFVRIFNEMKPKYFIFENVGGIKDDDKHIISKLLGVKPIRINSKLLSPALRNRLYWTNIEVYQPKDKGVKLQDVLTSGYTDREKARALLASDSRPLRDKTRMMHRYRKTGFTTVIFEDKNLTKESARYMNQIELERCMGLPDNYTKCLTRNQAAYHIGNGWTVPVITHIINSIDKS